MCWSLVFILLQLQVVKVQVNKKLQRQEKHKQYCDLQMLQCQTTSFTELSDNSSYNSASSGEMFVQNTKKPKFTGTTLTIKPDVLETTGAATDRLKLSANQVTGFIASLCNNSGGDINKIPLSQSTTLRHRKQSRKSGSSAIKQDFYLEDVGQINFDAKLMKDLQGHCFGKVNRLTVILSTDEADKLLCIAKVDGGTGVIEAEKIKEVLVEWGVSSHIIACGFDTTSSNTGNNRTSNLQ